MSYNILWIVLELLSLYINEISYCIDKGLQDKVACRYIWIDFQRQHIADYSGMESMNRDCLVQLEKLEMEKKLIPVISKQRTLKNIQTLDFSFLQS